jgi:hypothetical protein
MTPSGSPKRKQPISGELLNIDCGERIQTQFPSGVILIYKKYKINLKPLQTFAYSAFLVLINKW